MVNPLTGRHMTAIRTDQSWFYSNVSFQVDKIQVQNQCNTNRIEMNKYSRQGGFPSRVCSGSCSLLRRHYTGTHRGQILSAKPFEGGTAHRHWVELKCLRDKVLLEIEALAMVSGIHLVVGETLIAQHDWGCQDT